MALMQMSLGKAARGEKGSALSSFNYICREERYKRKKDLAFAESGNLPSWCNACPREYWKAADMYERSNGVVCRKIQFALPREIKDLNVLKGLIRKVIEKASGSSRLAWSYAVHDPGGDWSNPHCHILISERVQDGIERPPELFFKRFNRKRPDKGGCRKTGFLNKRSFPKDLRRGIAELTNELYSRLGMAVRIDPRSYLERGINKLPGLHLGPQLIKLDLRGVKSYILKERLVVRRHIQKAAGVFSRALQERLEKSLREIKDMASVFYREKLLDLYGWKKLLKAEFNSALTPPLKKLYVDGAVTYYLLPSGYTVKVPSKADYPEYARLSTASARCFECTKADFLNAVKNYERSGAVIGGRNAYVGRTPNEKRLKEIWEIERTLLQKTLTDGKVIRWSEIKEAFELDEDGEYECTFLEASGDDAYLDTDSGLVRAHMPGFAVEDFMSGDRLVLAFDREGAPYLEDSSRSLYLGR